MRKLDLRVIKILELDGWDFVPTGPDEWDWLKFNNEGKCVASCGSETWARDRKAAEDHVHAHS
jgi:hypothetical protein